MLTARVKWKHGGDVALTVGARLRPCRLYCASGPITILQGILPCVPDYRRHRVPGGSFFFTVNLLDRRSDLLVTQIQALRDAVRQVRRHAPFRIDAWVVLPTICTACGPYRQAMPSSPVAGAIKTAFSKAFPAREPRSPAITSRDGAASAITIGLVGSSPSRGAAIASSSRRRWRTDAMPRSLRSSVVKLGTRAPSMSLSRNTGSYCPSPRPRSPPAISMRASVILPKTSSDKC